VQQDETRSSGDEPTLAESPPSQREHVRARGGVMVVSAWTRAVAGVMFARITMSAADKGVVVRAVTRPDELHEVIDEWLASLERFE
jgi:hypothetical protein